MPFILWEALHFVSKELRAFRESSVKRKWRKHAIAGIMFVLLLFPNNVPLKNNWHSYHEPGWSSGQLTLLSVWPSCISCHRNPAKSPLPQLDISCPQTRYSGWLRSTPRGPLTQLQMFMLNQKLHCAMPVTTDEHRETQLTLPRVLLIQSPLFSKAWLQDPLLEISRLAGTPHSINRFAISSCFLSGAPTNTRRVSCNAAIAFPAISNPFNLKSFTSPRPNIRTLHCWLLLELTCFTVSDSSNASGVRSKTLPSLLQPQRFDWKASLNLGPILQHGQPFHTLLLRSCAFLTPRKLGWNSF